MRPSREPPDDKLIPPDFEVAFVQDHQPHGNLVGDASELGPLGHRVTVACPCGEAAEDLLRLEKLAKALRGEGAGAAGVTAATDLWLNPLPPVLREAAVAAFNADDASVPSSRPE